jgi:hypothetical protein
MPGQVLQNYSGVDMQCMVVLTVCRNHLERVQFIFVAAALFLVLVFAVPAR